MTGYLKLNEWIFVAAGIATLFAIPYLATAGFWLWAFVKTIYLIGIIVLFIEIKMGHV